jgi:hypothetical protein
VWQRHRAAHLLIGVAHVDAQPDVGLDGLRELRGLHLAHERHRLGGLVVLGAVDQLTQLAIALPVLAHLFITP